MSTTKPWLIWVLVGLVVVAGVGFAFKLLRPKTPPPPPQVNNPAAPLAQNGAVPQTPPNPGGAAPLAAASTKPSLWTEQGVAVAGNYADADIVKLDDGTYRLYYAIEPEVANGNLDIYSSTSKDGITWKKEDGVRQKTATFPDIFQTSDGQWRMNYQSGGVIKSSISKDGLSFTAEAGTRIDKTNDAGLTFDNVATPTTLKLADGSYLMVYRGSMNEAYTAELVPNKTIALLMFATSTDGKTWEKKGIALDSRTDTTQKGWMDGPELVSYDNSEVRLYWSTYTGVYHSVFSGGKFGTPVFAFQLPNPKAMPNDAMGGIPPGDPTIAKINDVWNMYYGVHTKGIYRATLK